MPRVARRRPERLHKHLQQSEPPKTSRHRLQAALMHQCGLSAAPPMPAAQERWEGSRCDPVAMVGISVHCGASWRPQRSRPSCRGRYLLLSRAGSVPSMVSVGSMCTSCRARARLDVSVSFVITPRKIAFSGTPWRPCRRGVGVRSACRVSCSTAVKTHRARARDLSRPVECKRPVVSARGRSRGRLVITCLENYSIH